MTDRVRQKRRNDVAAAKRRHDAKRRLAGYTQTQIWLNALDRNNAKLIRDRTNLTTLSDIISLALSESASCGTPAPEVVQSDENNAQQDVQPIEK